MLARHLEFGRDAEERALLYFSAQPGVRLLDRNYRFRGGEIDLIFEDRDELVFIEVRARAAGGLVQGFETLDWKKRHRLERVIRHYLARYRGTAKRLRLDVLSWDGKAWTHLRNAWL
jgi:putative endonuclease